MTLVHVGGGMKKVEKETHDVEGDGSRRQGKREKREKSERLAVRCGP